MKKNPRNIVMPILILVLALVWSGCQKANENAAEKSIERALEKATGGKAHVDISKGGLKVQTKDGGTEISSEAGEWPNDLPGFVPKLEGKVKGVIRSNQNETKNWMIILEDAEADAYAEYVKSLEAAGWKIEMNAVMDYGSTAQATKDNNSVMITYVKEKGNVTLNVTTGIK